MSKPSSAVATTRRHLCAACLGSLAATIVVLAAPATGLAGPRTDNTFAGSCAGLEGWASWPEHSLGVLPADMLLVANPRGGQCSGTVNGREVESVPAAATARLRGPQSCGVASTSGRFTFKLAGRRFEGKMTYRRIGSRVNALWQADGGGEAAVVARAQIGLVAEGHPLAGAPVVGPAITSHVSADEALRRCAGEGISRMPILVEQIRTVSALRSR
jgi:hypothetical protein